MISLPKPSTGIRELLAVSRVMNSGRLTQGPEVEKFERNFSESLLNGQEAIAVNSGTSGLHISLLAAGIGPGDEVIVPSFTFAGTVNSVALVGAKPVFCDIDPLTYNINPREILNLLGESTAAIIPVHLFGNPAPMQEIMKIGKEYGLLVIEDAAQAHGASINKVPVGTFGAAGTFSLYATKNISTGEGGIVTSGIPNLLRTARLLRNQGMEKRYENELVGMNCRMTEIQGAIGQVQLSRLEGWTRKRIRNAKYLKTAIENIPGPAENPDSIHVFHQFTVRVDEDRDRFAEALSKEWGIESGIYYPTPVHLLKPFRKIDLRSDLPETIKASNEVLSLPIGPALSRRNLDHIAKAVDSLAKAGG